MLGIGVFLIFGDDPNEITGREKKEETPAMNGLQHKLEILATKSLYASTEKYMYIFIKIPEVKHYTLSTTVLHFSVKEESL